jgi:hypothetical protein
MWRTVGIRARLPKLSPSDGESIDREIERLIGEGWTDDEIVRFCKCTEECKCPLSEEKALAKMRTIIEFVKRRQEQEKK